MNRCRLLTTASAAGAAPLGRAAQREIPIFLLIGQSNMVGRGIVEAEDRQPLPRVFAQDRNL